jgi:hypothetical protein
MKRIPLTKNQFALVDDSDYEYLNQWRWHYNCGYAERKEYRNGKQIHIQMHRVILNTDKMVDHISGNKLDNRKANLRIATHSLNAMNMRKHRGKSVYKGVSTEGKYWRVQIWKDGERAFSTMAPTELMGALIYDLNAPILFGQYARLNFPNALIAVSTADEPHG